MATPFKRLEGKYEILAKIREGGMGSVYKVRHRLLDEIRVIKVMRPHLADDEVLKARFLREAQVAIKLRHPNIAQIYDFTIDDDGYAYLVMEFIDGFNLQEVTRVLEKPPLGMVLEIAAQSLNALGYLHRKRMIHRDVSPDNLLVTRDEDGRLLVKLIDLGIVKIHHEGDDSLTSAGTFLGKVRYSSPEHFRSHEGVQVSEVSDLYSFGVVLYELLTATYPIKGTSVASLISGHLMHPPTDFDTSDPDGRVPAEIRNAVLKTLEKDPEARFQSARHLRDALEPARGEHPIEEESLYSLFEVPNLITKKIATVKPGSSQSRIDDTFKPGATPARTKLTTDDEEFESSGTVTTGGVAKPGTDPATMNVEPQLRALLVGAKKLMEAEHFADARMQINSVLELDPDSQEAAKLMQAVEAADIETRRRRQEAAREIRAAIGRQHFDGAADLLEHAVEELGTAEILDEVRSEIETARAEVDRRRKLIAAIESEAAELCSDERYDQAAALLREGTTLDPNHAGLKKMLDEAERDLASQVEARRRQRELDDAAATIRGHIEDGDADHGERALELARKLFGSEPVFADLSKRLDELRHKQRLDGAAELRISAQNLIEQHSFEEAIGKLEQARELAPEVDETEELLAAAEKGLQVQLETQRRQRIVDVRTAEIDRLVTAGRFESAARRIDATAQDVGPFDEERALRERIDREIKSRENREKKLCSTLEGALDHAAKDAFSEANEALDEARAAIQDHPEMDEQVAEAEAEVQRRLEAHRRQMALDNVIASVVARIEKGELVESRRELSVAQRLYGSSDLFDDLRSQIDARGRELRRQEVEDLIIRSQRATRTAQEAISDLEEALGLDPNNERAQRLLVAARATEARRRDDELETEHEARFEDIDAFIAAGELEAAIAALDEMTTEVGDFRSARRLRSRLVRQIDCTS
ncbi:MAG: protein kinase [Holophagae bacterium]